MAGEIFMGVVLWSIISTLGLFTLSRRRRAFRFPDARHRFVFLIPALNEGRVLRATLEHLTSFPVERIIVVDDASDDDTQLQAAAVDDPRIVVLRRELPNARRGKGAALNHAYRWLRAGELGRDPGLIVGVLDADGRLEDSALTEVSAAFADPGVGACQISVRIRNRTTSFWTRMQHFEFVAFTALYQGGRERIGSVGLGGNGQFVRLRALEDLGDEPWTACLTEDMDLGIRLLLAGWRNRYVPTAWVSQQAIPDAQRLLRQRTRWFQGTLQCLGRLPAIAGSQRLGLVARMDLVGALVAPVIVLVLSPILMLGWIQLAAAVVAGTPALMPGWAAALVSYAFAFGPFLMLSYTYWLDEPTVTLPEALIAGHAFVFYGYLWVFSGWRALWRMLLKEDAWTKTVRVVEAGRAA